MGKSKLLQEILFRASKPAKTAATRNSKAKTTRARRMVNKIRGKQVIRRVDLLNTGGLAAGGTALHIDAKKRRKKRKR